MPSTHIQLLPDVDSPSVQQPLGAFVCFRLTIPPQIAARAC